MTLIDIVNDLLRRADLAGDAPRVVLANEASLWPAGAVDSLEEAGFLLRSSALDRVSCEECDEPHSERVLFLESGGLPPRPFIPCPNNGRVFLEPSSLWQWRVDPGTIAKKLGVALQTEATPAEVIRGRSWSLGLASPPTGPRPAYLLRGACWPDAISVFDRNLPREPTAVLFVLSQESPSWSPPGNWLPLGHAMRLEGTELHFDFSGLALGGPGQAINTPYSLRRRGKLWELVYDNQLETIPHRVRMLYLAHLLQHPGRTFRAMELVALAEGHLPTTRTGNEDLAALASSTGYDNEDLVDREARQQYQRRIEELDAKKGSLGLSDAEEHELQTIRDHLAGALGIRGKPRKVVAQSERARSSVWHALQRVYQAIEEVLPRMAQYLRNSIVRGSDFSYHPHEPVFWSIDLGRVSS